MQPIYNLCHILYIVVHMIVTQFHGRKQTPQCICNFIIKFPVDFRYPEAQRFVRNTLNNPNLKDLWPVEDVWKKVLCWRYFDGLSQILRKEESLSGKALPLHRTLVPKGTRYQVCVSLDCNHFNLKQEAAHSLSSWHL